MNYELKMNETFGIFLYNKYRALLDSGIHNYSFITHNLEIQENPSFIIYYLLFVI